MTAGPLPEPRMFFLPQSVSHPSRELPPGWREFEPGRESAEITPGVRVSLVRTGELILPDGSVDRGAVIAVWAEAEATAGVVDEDGSLLTSGGYQTWNTEPYILERYP